MAELEGMRRGCDPALFRCLELAHDSYLAGGLPVGSVIVAEDGTTISEGRNRAYDPAGGAARLQRTPIAHAELNALAGIATGVDLAVLRLWSSHQPCLMCAAACEFTGVGSVRFVAPDPSEEIEHPDPADVASEWVVVANLLFLAGVSEYAGMASPTVSLARDREPEVAALLMPTTVSPLRQPSLAAALGELWPEIVDAANLRRRRCARTV
jgi:tRNA(Arg) A34 adenosine deaminase TadA